MLYNADNKEKPMRLISRAKGQFIYQDEKNVQFVLSKNRFHWELEKVQGDSRLNISSFKKLADGQKYIREYKLRIKEKSTRSCLSPCSLS